MAAAKFIVFEGGEGSGKSTHVRVTAEYLQQQQIAAITTHEPGGTVIGQNVRQLLLNTTKDQLVASSTELFLFLADRAQHVSEQIQPSLNRDITVLCDRFTGSTLAYQIGARQLPNPELIIAMEQYARNNLQPDLVVYLDVNPEIGLARKHKQMEDTLTRFDKETLEFHNDVRSYFLQLAKADPEHWVVIDANRPVEQVQADVLHSVQNLWTS